MKSTKKKNTHSVQYSKNLLDKIDGMKSDKDYNPYTSTKKQSVTDKEMFNDALYRDEDDIDEDEEIGTKNTGAIIAVVIVVVVLVVATILLIKFL